MIEFLKVVQKYGVNGILCVVVWWMNARLNVVEERLYDCLTKPVMTKSVNRNSIDHKSKLIAILPTNDNKKRRYER